MPRGGRIKKLNLYHPRDELTDDSYRLEFQRVFLFESVNCHLSTLNSETHPIIMKQSLFLLLTLAYFTSCRQNENNKSVTSKSDNASHKNSSSAENVPEHRKEIKKEAVAVYKEKTDDPLNDWYFTVRLFETDKTFNYVLKMQFEEIKGEDTLTIPNFGIDPKPELRKGKDKYSCIIGFIDRDNKFREYKLVYVKDGSQLKLTTLNHYSVVSAEK